MLKTYMNPLYSDIKNYAYNKIMVESSCLYDNNGRGFLFYLLNFVNLQDDEILDSLYLELRSIQYSILDKYDVYFIEDSTTSFSDIVTSISNNQLTPILSGVEKWRDLENGQDVINVFLTKLNKKLLNNKTFIITLKSNEEIPFAARNSYFNRYNVNTHLIKALAFSTLDINQASKIDTYGYDGNTQVMVDEFDGNVITNVNLFSTLNKKTPINLSIIRNNNKTPDISYLPLNMMMSYQYEVETESINNSGVGYIIKDAFGNKKRFFIINSLNENDYGKYFNHGRSESYKYYCEEDGSCMYLNPGSTTYLYVYDKNRTVTTFALPSGDLPFRLISIETIEGKGIYYTWNGKYLQSISTSSLSSDVKDVTFTYDSSNKINVIDYPKLKLKVRFILSSYQVQIKYIRYDNDDNIEEELKTVSLYYVGDKLDTISNSMNNEQMILVYDGYNRLSEIKTYKNNNILERFYYQYFSNKTVVNNQFNQSITSFFDNCRRLITEIDYFGNSVNYDYFDGTNLLKNKTIIKFKSGVIKNSSFEDVKDNYVPHWNLSLNTSKVESADGVYGKCLKIKKDSSTTSMTISQTIYDLTGKLNSISCLVKHTSFYYNNFSITVAGKYYVGNTSYPFSTSFPALTTTSWEELKISNLGIPSTATKVEATLQISMTGNQSSSVLIDEFKTNLDEDKIVENNLVINGDFKKESLSSWSKSSSLITSVLTNTDENLIKLFGEKYVRLSKNGSVYQNVNMSGKAGDSFCYSFMYKLSDYHQNIKPFIKFYDDATVVEEYEFDVNKIEGEWVIFSKTITTNKSYQSIRLGVNVNISNTIDVGNIVLLKLKNATYYSYDEIGNITEISNGNLINSHILYDDNNRIDLIISNDGTRFKYNYENEKLVSIIDSKGNKIKYTYDTNGFENSKTLEFGNETITNTKNNDNDGYVLNQFNEFNDFYTHTLDRYKNITEQGYPNNEIINYTYTKNNDLFTLSDDEFSHLLNYNSDQSVDTISSFNNVYKFGYNNYGTLSNIKLNDVLLCSYGYKVINNYYTSLLSSKSYDSSGNSYSFNYDSRNRLIEVRYKSDSIISYSYDENDNISTVVDKVNGVTKRFTYNRDNQLTKVVILNKQENNYFYDNLGNIQKSTYYLNSKYRWNDYNYTYEKNKATFDGYVQKLINLYNVDVITGETRFKGLFGMKNGQMNMPLKTINNIKCYSFFEDTTKAYVRIDDANVSLSKFNSRNNFDYEEWKKDFDEQKTIGLWFRPTGNTIKTSIMKLDIESSPNNPTDIRINENGYVEVYDYYGEVVRHTSTLSIKKNEWNLLTISFVNGEATLSINGTISGVFECRLTRNINRIKIYDQWIEGEHYSSESGVPYMPLDISLIFVGNVIDNIYLLYKDGLKLLNMEQNVSFDSVQYAKNNINSSYDMVSFNGSLVSSRNIEPEVFLSENNKDLFVLDDSEKKYYLASYDTNTSNIYGYKKIGYNFDFLTNGMFSIRFKLDSNCSSVSRQLLFVEDKDTLSKKLEISFQNNILQFKIDNVSSISPLTLSYDVWHTITVFYTTSSVSIYLDGINKSTLSNTSLNLSNSITYIGGLLNNKLNGCIENFVYSKASVNTSLYSARAQELHLNKFNIKHINTYDNLNRLTSKDIKAGSNTFTQSYTYNKTRVSEECLLDESRRYTYDSMGNVIKIERKAADSETYSNLYEYEYDLQGRIDVEKNYETNRSIKYNYENGNLKSTNIKDLNGNVISNTGFTHNFSDDRLTAIILSTSTMPSVTISYNGHYPSSIYMNNKTRAITYEGKRIKTYGNNEYFYNEEGVRIKKNTETNKTHEYIVEGSKILYEKIYTTGTTTTLAELYYNYNQYGELVSVEYNNKLYFYIKDILGNIVKIIDETGNTIVKYSYNSWGVVTKTTLSSNESDYKLAQYNPFMYKGYYYDVETQLFYCNSRYYSPELGRFLQVSDVSELNPHSINGLNLYAYANNNPISFSYNNSSAFGSANVGGGLASSIGAGTSFSGNVNSGSTSKGGLNLGWLANGLDAGSTIHGLYTSISGLVNHTTYFAKNLAPFADDMTMLGASMKDGVLAFNQFSWGLGKSDVFGIALGVGLDIYDSIQRGVSPGGVVLGATLTAAKGVGLIYLNKGIMYGATAIGSCFGPVGTVVGFVVGGVVCIVVDIFASNWLDDLIDKIAK